MKKVFMPLCAACMVLAITSCRSSKETAGLSAINGEWDIVEINGSAVSVAAGQSVPYIGFEATSGKISGNSGCNRMMGSFDVNAKPGVLDMGNVGSTRMLCNDMTTETNVLNAFKNVRGYRVVDDNKIALTNARNRPVIVLQRKTADSQLAGLEGEWQVTEAGGVSIPAGLSTPNKQPYIVFDTAKKSIHGNAGCNIINGGFTIDEKNPDAIAFPAVAATMMACPDMDIERKVMTAINDSKSYRFLSAGSVAFYNAAGVTTMILSKKLF